jgi:hypothetical protein
MGALRNPSDTGSRTDPWTDDSLYALAKASANRFHAETLVYPTLAAGSPIASLAALWTWSGYAVIVPAGVIAVDFHLLAVQIESCDQDGVYEFEIYQGAADDLIAAFRLVVNGGFFGNVRYPLSAEPTVAGSQLRARVSGGNGLITNFTLSIEYNVFP